MSGLVLSALSPACWRSVGTTEPRHTQPSRSDWLRAARTAAVITGVLLLLLISRSEIRKTLLTQALALPLLALGTWIGVLLVVRWRGRGKRSRRSDRGAGRRERS